MQSCAAPYRSLTTALLWFSLDRTRLGATAGGETARDAAVTIVATFEFYYYRFRDPTGEAVGALPEFARDPGELVARCRGRLMPSMTAPLPQSD